MKAGTIITCPECARALLKTTKDLAPGDQMKDAGFESLGFDMTNQRSGCPDCGTRFVRQHPKTGKTQLHTEKDGWIPLSKEKPVVHRP